MTALLWYTRDLRVHDHPALRAALAGHEHVVPVFCFDRRLLQGRNTSVTRTAFMLECLSDLDESLRKLGGRLLIRQGLPERELATLAQETSASEVHASGDLSPYAEARLRRVEGALDDVGAKLCLHEGNSIVGNARALKSSSGGPYTVFTPFSRAWQAAPRREVLAAPRKLTMPSGLRVGRMPSLRSLGLTGEGVPDPSRGGETEARKRLKAFLAGPVEDYGKGQDALSSEGVSRLSPYLRFGCVSPLEIESRLGEGEGPREFARQLCWRDFFRHLLHHFPNTVDQELQERRRGTLAWRQDDEAFAAWRKGRTGYPLVDAGMRQLLSEGWMHNRVRMLVGSFLTKDLGIDWRAGERWFMKMLLDGDPASNVGNWQWIASVGSDRQPVSCRVLSPSRQLQRFDPEGVYVKRYVPELANVEGRRLAEPWLMSEAEQCAASCTIGVDYPEPIVDHAQARREALERYGAQR